MNCEKNIFGPILFKFSQITVPELADVRNFSLKAVCRVFCGNQCEVPLPIGYLTHMIRIITSALCSPEQSTVSVVIQHSKRIFMLDYRGLFVLIPIYLNQIQTVLAHNSGFSPKTKSAAVTILSSLLCLPDHFNAYEIPLIIKSDGNTKMTMMQVKDLVYDEIIKMLQKYSPNDNPDPVYTKAINKSICCATIIIYHETSKPAFSTDLIKVFLLSYL